MSYHLINVTIYKHRCISATSVLSSYQRHHLQTSLYLSNKCLIILSTSSFTNIAVSQLFYERFFAVSHLFYERFFAVSQLFYERFLPNFHRDEGSEQRHKYNQLFSNDLYGLQSLSINLISSGCPADLPRLARPSPWSCSCLIYHQTEPNQIVSITLTYKGKVHFTVERQVLTVLFSVVILKA